jgi:DNA-binding transcriptional MerR regulator
MASEAALYTIGQLADLAGVTPRTIRYYTAEGLLPRPDARGQYALYGDEHLLRLQLIGQLKEAYLPLSEIKARIDHLDDAQIRALLDAQHESPAPPASAADYLAQLRARQQAPPARRRLAERGEPYPAAEAPMLSLHPPAAPAPAARAPAPPAYGFAAPIPGIPMQGGALAAAPPPEEAEAAAPPQQASLLRKLMPQHRPSAQKDAARADAAAPRQTSPHAEQHWRRIDLAPGVELHIREPAAPALRERIEQLIALAHHLFEIGD